MKKSLFLLLATLLLSLQALAFEGSAPRSGQRYYLYNLYQSKFLTAGNRWGTQASLGNDAPLLCTLTASGSGYTINTHYQGTDNYLYALGDEAWVDAHEGQGSIHPWLVVKNGNAYQITYGTQSLLFGQGTALTLASRSEGFNADKGRWLLVSEEEYAAYRAKKRFTLAALNVDGMPKRISAAGIVNIDLNPDAKEEAGATAIGEKIRTLGYDVIALSEDFNYHDEIMAALDGSGYASQTHRASLGYYAGLGTKYLRKQPLFDTDGLGLLNQSATTSISGESWTAWNTCNGYDSDGADGLIRKGYRYYLVTLADGTEIDLYIHHMDAETSEGDLAARESQLTQLADAILSTNNHRPIVVMGDTNCRYTRDRLKTLFLDVLNADPRFTAEDPWIAFGRGGIYPTYGGDALLAQDLGYREGEVVDKLFLINNTESDIRLEVESYAQDLSFVDAEGEPLADHWPCVVELSYHAYDPQADDDADSDNPFEGEVYYLKNARSGYYLSAGGWWGNHAVQGVYGMPVGLVRQVSGRYVIQTERGFLSQDDPYVDASSAAEWTLIKGAQGYFLTYGAGKALTGNDATTFAYGPNTRYVTCATYNKNDLWQQWQLVSRDEMLSDARFASASEPMNLTHLLPGANFDRGDALGIAQWQGWPDGATKMTYNKSDGAATGETEQGNHVAEVYVMSYEKSFPTYTSYATTWTISQTLTGLPNGHYRVSVQAFQRVADKLNNSGDVFFFVGDQRQRILDIASVQCSEAIGATHEGGYYFPNSMAEAAAFFNRGYYEQAIEVDVTDGTLYIGIGKAYETVGSNVWTCFDNFQLEYYPATTLERGDMNHDGRLTLSDLTRQQEYINQGQGDKGMADMDGNHFVNNDDVVMLRNRLLGN